MSGNLAAAVYTQFILSSLLDDTNVISFEPDEARTHKKDILHNFSASFFTHSWRNLPQVGYLHTL